MIISVVVPDKTIVIDGEALQFDFSYTPRSLHAIQWNGANGHMEFKAGANQFFDNAALIEDYILQFNEEKARLAAAAEAAAQPV